jgi:S1-C subfamily serine protease
MLKVILSITLLVSGLLGWQSTAFSSALPQCNSSDNYWHNCVGSYDLPNGDKFFGQFLNNEFHVGKYTFGQSSEFVGDTYTGSLRNGEWHGIGTYQHSSGERYVGQFKNGWAAGYGARTYVGGDKYIGESNGKAANGWGIHKGELGEYIGEFQNDTYHGFGIFTLNNGDRHIGQFINGQATGQGVWKLSRGDEYVGDFLNGEYHGHGKYTYKNGEVVEGEWANGEFLYASDLSPSKQATKKPYLKPFCLTGNYRNNCFGELKINAEQSYVGEFLNNTAFGKGAVFFASGGFYVGDFLNDTFHGKGLYAFPDGDRFAGEYKDNKLNGFGLYVYSEERGGSGDIAVGQHKNGVQEGTGHYIFGPNSKWAGESFFGEYRNDKRDGMGRYIRASGDVLKDFWKDGSRDNTEANTGAEPKVTNKKLSPSDNKLVSASSGSGFAVSNDGYVVTNNHVIDSCEQVYIHNNGAQIPARVVTQDRQNDIALLKANFKPKETLPLSESRPELLQDIYVAGFPFGMSLSSSIKVTKGIISSLTGIGNNFSEMQIDAALQSGNSGGPILDNKGNVIGVAVAKLDMKYALSEFGSIPENTNFGVKSNVVGSMLDSNGVKGPKPNPDVINKSELGKRILNGTYYISCWMTMAQIENMKNQRVLFDEVN